MARRTRPPSSRWSISSIPGFGSDPDTKGITEITLSYTFFPRAESRR